MVAITAAAAAKLPMLMLLLLASSSVRAMPQTDDAEVSLDDIAGAAGDAARYGGGAAKAAAPTSIADDVFGTTNSDYQAPKQVTEDKCSNHAETGFSCTPFHLCDEDTGYVIEDGEGLIDVRIAIDPFQSTCKGDLEVCCRDPAYDGTPLVTTTTTTLPPPIPYSAGCGRRNFNGVGVRIKNPSARGNTQFGEYPHTCVILKVVETAGEQQNLFVCGASLIGKDTVLTAAHCFSREGAPKLPQETHLLKVRCGEWDTQRAAEPRPHQDRLVRSVHLHPEFNSKNLHDDFAVMHLDEPFDLQPHIDTMCLPEVTRRGQRPIYETNNCVVTGWGKDRFGKEGDYQVVLRQVNLDLVNHDTCERALRRERLGKKFQLDDSFVCAIGQREGEDACQGDGGGALICPVNGGDTYVQAGIVAWGLGCGTKAPGVYADVRKGLCFIDWAVRCERGDAAADAMGIRGGNCARWQRNVDRRYANLKRRLTQLPDLIDIEENRFQRAKLRKEKRKAEAAIERYEQTFDSCRSRPNYRDDNDDDDDYYDDDDSTDVSGFARDGVSEKSAGSDAAGNDEDPRAATIIDEDDFEIVDEDEDEDEDEEDDE